MLPVKVLHTQKAGAPPQEYEDSSALSADASLVAVSDGAGSAFESGRWAGLLTSWFITSPPGPTLAEVLDWASAAAARWDASFDVNALESAEQDRVLDEGSAATFVGLFLHEEFPGGGGRWDCIALGDSCLFHVAGDRLVDWAPVTSSEDFGTSPPLLYTMRRRTELTIGNLATKHGVWAPSDTFLLLTDAMAEWFLRECEHGARPWEALAVLDEESFPDFIYRLRAAGDIRDDDMTAVILGARVPAVLIKPVEVLPEPGPVQAPSEPVLALVPDPRGTGDHDAPEEGPSGPGTDPGERLPDTPLPHPDQTGEVARSTNGHRRGVARALYLVPLVVAFLLGLVVGRALVGTSPPLPRPPASGSAASAMEASADRFAQALVTSDGHLGDYVQALDAHATGALARRLPSLLGLVPGRFKAMTSTGTVAFTARGNGQGIVYVGAVQHLSIGGRPQAAEFLVVRLAMTFTGGSWRVNGIAFEATATGSPYDHVG